MQTLNLPSMHRLRPPLTSSVTPFKGAPAGRPIPGAVLWPGLREVKAATDTKPGQAPVELGHLHPGLLKQGAQHKGMEGYTSKEPMTMNLKLEMRGIVLVPGP